VFLDEVGELPLSIQAKLLRVLQDGCFLPIGGSTQRKSKARVLAATNRDLEAMVTDGKFREDLLYRLNATCIHLPPLRERKEDIPLLAQSFLESFCAKYKKSLHFHADALAVFQEQEWTGNIRVLKNTVERLAIAASGNVIKAADLIITKGKSKKVSPTPMAGIGAEPVDLQKVIDNWEKEIMEQAIQRFRGNRTLAAMHLGYKPPAFRKKCRIYFGRKK
jgi:DNA-binding NtrC family response regulator